MTLKQAIKEADRIFITVHMTPGISDKIKITKKDSKIISQDYLDREFVHDNIENEEGSIIAFYDIERSFRGHFSTLYLGR